MSLILEPVYAYKGKHVGEVRIKVKLTNGVDETLCRSQQLAPERVRTCETEAMVDAGAVRTIVPPRFSNNWDCRFAASASPNTPTDEKSPWESPDH